MRFVVLGSPYADVFGARRLLLEQALDKNLRVSFEVVKLAPCHRQIVEGGGGEAPLLKPMRGTRRQNEQALQAEGASFALQLPQEMVGASLVAIFRMHRNTS